MRTNYVSALKGGRKHSHGEKKNATRVTVKMNSCAKQTKINNSNINVAESYSTNNLNESQKVASPLNEAETQQRPSPSHKVEKEVKIEKPQRDEPEIQPEHEE